MGIKGFMKLIERSHPNAIKIHSIEYLRGKTVLIDANNYIYKWYSIKVGNPNINHLQGVFYRTISLICAGATPVYIFDGRPPDEKAATIAARKHIREMGGVKVPLQAFADVKKIITMLGCDYINAPGEAEAQCAKMNADCAKMNADCAKMNAEGPKKSTIVMSDDSDTLAFGASEICRINADGKVKIIDGRAIGSVDVIIDIAIKLGCDYEGSPQTIRKLFKHPVVDVTPTRIPGLRNIIALREFLVSAGMNGSRVDKAITRLHGCTEL